MTDKKLSAGEVERAAFEAAIIKVWPDAPVHVVRDLLPVSDPRYNDYVDQDIRAAWVGWQARAALSHQPECGKAQLQVSGRVNIDDSDMVLVPRGLLGAAACAVRERCEAPNVLAHLREYSKAQSPDAGALVEALKSDLLFLADYVWRDSCGLPMPNYLALDRYPLDVAKAAIAAYRAQGKGA